MIDQAEITSEQGLSRRQTSSDYFLFEGDDLSIGYNLGLLWKIDECFTFGATFRSAVTLGFDGETNISGRNINGSDIPALGMRAPVTYSTKAQCRMIITALSSPIWTVISSLSALDGSGRNTPSIWPINSAMVSSY